MSGNNAETPAAPPRMAWLLRLQYRLGLSPLQLGVVAALLFLSTFVINLIAVYEDLQPAPRELWKVSVIAVVNSCAIGYACGFLLWSARRAREDLIMLAPLMKGDGERAADAIVAPLSRRTMLVVVIMTVIIWCLVNLVFGSIGRQLRGEQAVNPLYYWNVPVFMALWLVMVYSFATMVRMANRLARLGRHAIRIDLLATHRLSSFMMIGQRSMMVAVGGLTFLLVQAALVGEISTVDWLPPLLLILPLAVWLFLRPMWGIRNAIRQARDAELERLDREIGHRDSWSTEAIANPQLEALIRHRERVLSVSEWPVTSSALWRPILYFVIPPFAWFAAALVENLVDAVL